MDSYRFGVTVTPPKGASYDRWFDSRGGRAQYVERITATLYPPHTTKDRVKVTFVYR